MTLFSVPRATKVLVLSLALATGGMTAANARDEQPGIGWSDGGDISGRTLTERDRHERRDWRPRNRQRYDNRRVDRHRDRNGWQDRNFYGGAISAYRDPGNGLYFYIDRDRYYDTLIDAPFVENRGPKVITVTPGQDGCSWEAGVCVIRPGS
jgi:hypothetical protein